MNNGILNKMIIKERCEDFLVDEIPNKNFYQEAAAQYHVYKLKKTNYTTERALSHVGRALHVPRKYLSFAGTKDKNAITTQYITISGAKRDKVDALELKDLELTFVGYRKEPFSLGELQGNTFSILVKDVEYVQDIPDEFYVPNYFDEQRFSTHNVELGKLILKKKYQEAVELIMNVDGDYKESFATHLGKHINDYIGALRLIPRRILLFYIHSVQSYIFNLDLQKKIYSLGECKEVKYSEGIFSFLKKLLLSADDEEGELFGFDSQGEKEGIEPYDFINRSLPEISLDGGKRPLYSKVSGCILTQEEQGVRAKFNLGKGSYATIVLKQLFG